MGLVEHNKLSIGEVITNIVSSKEVSVGAQNLISLMSGEDGEDMKSSTDRFCEPLFFAGVGASGSIMAMRYGFPIIWVLLDKMANEGMLAVSVRNCEQNVWLKCKKQRRTRNGQICASSHGEPRAILVSEDNLDREARCEVGGNDIGDDF